MRLSRPHYPLVRRIGSECPDQSGARRLMRLGTRPQSRSASRPLLIGQLVAGSWLNSRLPRHRPDPARPQQRSGLFWQPRPITPTRRRGVPLSMCGWEASVDDVLRRHGTPSQTEPAGTPEPTKDQQISAGSLREVSMYGGRHLPVLRHAHFRRGSLSLYRSKSVNRRGYATARFTASMARPRPSSLAT
jgi:hypothetical protein